MIKFAIRDDDINYFTKPEELEGIYKNIWDKIPISLAVVPFQSCTKTGAVPEKHWNGNEVFPIENNNELVSFLKGKIRENKVSIMLHGYSHKDYKNGHEFGAGENLHEKVKEGRTYLENLFSVKIKTFVPPHNFLSKKGLSAVISNGLNILGSFSFSLNSRPFELNNVVNFIKRKSFQLKNKCFYYPFPIKFINHSELDCFSLISSTDFDTLRQRFELAVNYGGNFCLALHYWEAHGTLYDMFIKFISYLNEYDKIEFVNDKNIFDSQSK